MFFDGNGWFGSSELVDVGGDIWQVSPDGLGGLIISEYDPVADMGASLVMILIAALSLTGIIFLGPSLIVALSVAIFGYMGLYALSMLLHPVAGIAVFSTSCVYAFGTLFWACVDMFETHNPIFLFALLALAAAALLFWAYFGMGADDVDYSGIGGFLAIALIVVCGLDCAYLFFTGFSDDRARYAVYAFRIARYVVLGGLGSGALLRVLGVLHLSDEPKIPLGALVGLAFACCLGLVPPVVAGVLGMGNALVTTVVMIALYGALVMFMPNLGKAVRMSPEWLLIPLVVETVMFFVSQNLGGVVISVSFVDSALDFIATNPLLTLLCSGTATAIMSFAEPLSAVCSAVVGFVLGIFDVSVDPFAVPLMLSSFVLIIVCWLSVNIGLSLRTKLAIGAARS